MKLLRLSLFRNYLFLSKNKKKALIVINIGIFLSIFAATSAIISLYIENKINEAEFLLIENQEEKINQDLMIREFPRYVGLMDQIILEADTNQQQNEFLMFTDFGNKVVCNISDPDIAEQAKRENKTRAQMSMRVAASEMNGGIVAIGNAPTALLEVIRMISEGVTKPALVVGIPVGFVAAAESKEKLQSSDVPFITNIGRKGGSSCTASIVNALYRLLRESS